MTPEQFLEQEEWAGVLPQALPPLVVYAHPPDNTWSEVFLWLGAAICYAAFITLVYWLCREWIERHQVL